MVDHERGDEDDTGRFEGEATDDDSVDLLAEASEASTEDVVERLRESGPRQHVSEESVDDVLSELDGGADGRGAGTDNAAGRTSEGLVGGGPSKTVSQDGIDDVFERLENEAPDHGASGGTASETTVSANESTDVASGSSGEDGMGALSGGGPTTTVSDDGVDDILSQVSDVEYATFDGDDALDGVAETEVDPDAVFPDDWDESDPVDDGADGADSGVDAGAFEDEDVPLADEHTPAEDADDLRPDDADDAMVDLLADAAEDVEESPDVTDPVDGGTDAPDLADADGALFGADESLDPTDDEVAEPTDDDLDPEVDALLAAADEVEPADGDAVVDSPGDADEAGDGLALNADDEASVEWSEGGDVSDRASFPPEPPRATAPEPSDADFEVTVENADASTPDREGADPSPLRSPSSDDEEADGSSDAVDGRLTAAGYARSVVGWFRSVMARLV